MKDERRKKESKEGRKEGQKKGRKKEKTSKNKKNKICLLKRGPLWIETGAI
jgi:hypothetical protein